MPKKQCSQVGCTKLINFTVEYCDDHKEINHDTLRNKVNYEWDKKYKKFYNSAAWKRLRRTVMIENNWACANCERNSIYVRADVVDHIIEIKDDWDRRLDISNLEPLCHLCHNQKSERERRRRRNG